MSCESLEVSNLIFDPCIKFGHHIEKAFCLLYYCSLLFLWSDHRQFFLDTGWKINTAAAVLLSYRQWSGLVEEINITLKTYV